jgi:hypothetical protein
VNTLLNTTTPDGRTLLSTLNFETSHEPTEVCANAVAHEFSPSEHVSATVYRGQSLVPSVIEGSFTVENTSAIGMPDALMTLVLAPRDEAAVAYFVEFPSEYINLDDLYMSHALDESVLPLELSNSMIGVADGRAQIVLDEDLLAACPLEISTEYDPSPESSNKCVTTRDWTREGAQARTSSTHMYFVRRVTNSDGDRAWLQDNIFADDTASAAAFLEATVNIVPLENRVAAQTYWVWPIFQWPGASPIGLKDTTVVSFAWSVSSAQPPAALRRLLGFAEPPTVHERMSTREITKKNNAELGFAHKSAMDKKRENTVRRSSESLSKILEPKVDYARQKRAEAVLRQKISQIGLNMPKKFL